MKEPISNNNNHNNNKRSSQRIKQNVPNFNENSSGSSDVDTENVKMTSRQKQIRLVNKTVSGTNNTSNASLQIKLKMPSAQSQNQTQIQKDVEIKLPKDMDPEPVCPICLKIIIGDIDDINEHVDECIGPSSSNTSSITITPVNSGICTPDEIPRGSSLSLINVDEDDFGYGKSQYSEEDVDRIIKADLNASKKKVSPETIEAEKQETKNSLLIQGILSASAPNSDFLSLQIALKSLLDRISVAPKCAVCWETLKMPAVASVNCWHVCCEGCWLRTLGTKRLCPHCSTITNPSDLRKVFF